MSFKHGETDTKNYGRWRNMLSRCYNSNRRDYKNYGGRGIQVCERWKNSYLNFVNDMGKPPFEGCQLDRIDSNGNYEKQNCRWVSTKEQSMNRGISSRAKYSKFKGVRFDPRRSTWTARITVDRKFIYLGRFENEIEAAKAYNEAAKKHFGEFAWLNKI